MTRCETVVRIGTQAMTSIIEYGGSVKNNLRPVLEKRSLIAYAVSLCMLGNLHALCRLLFFFFFFFLFFFEKFL